MAKNFKTVVKSFYKCDGSDYLLGVINGILYATCGKDSEYTFGGTMTQDEEGNVTIYSLCDETDYEKFTAMVKKLYPALCVFDA